MNGKGQSARANSGAAGRGRGNYFVALHFSRCLRRAAAAGSGLALLSMMTLTPLVASPASASGTAPASGTAWYAYANGSATGTPSSCPQTATTSLQCTLAEALAAAVAGDTVYLASPGGTGTGDADYVGNWTVATAGTSASTPLTIEAASGVADPTLDGDGGSNSSPCSTSACNGPLLMVSNSTFVDFVGVTFQNADNTSAAPYGGAIQNDAGGTLAVDNCTFSDDTASDGGAIANAYSGTGTVTVSASTFASDSATADGGAIVNGELAGSTATLVVTGSTFSGNKASTDDGGAIDSGDYQATGNLTIASSTFSGNSAQYDGGAIDNGDDSGNGTLSVSSDTFSSNSAEWGGAIDNGDTAGAGTLSIAGFRLH